MVWHILQKVLWVVLEAAVVGAIVGLWAWSKYTRARLRFEERDEKAGVQSLFDGEK